MKKIILFFYALSLLSSCTSSTDIDSTDGAFQTDNARPNVLLIVADDHGKDAIGAYDNTLILCISDNGMAFPGAKTTLYQAGMELPCIVKPAKTRSGGQVTQAMVSWVVGQKDVDSFLRRPRFELYDIEKDPWEAVNLAIDPQYSEILNGLVEQVKVFQEKTGDPWGYKWTYE